MIIDIHAHTFPDELAPRAVKFLCEQADEPAFTDGTNDALRVSQRVAGIDLSIVMPIATKPSHARTINAWAAGVNRMYDDLVCFGTLHPDQDDWREEIDRLVKDGIKGIKLHPDYQKFFVDEARVMPVYRALADAGLILLMHAGVDIGLPEPVHCPPERLSRVLDAVPDLTIIAAHMGGFRLWDEVEQHLVGREVYFDTSYTMEYLCPERMTALIRAHGPQRVLFGTDSPWDDQAKALAEMRELPLADEDLSAILGENARKLLNL